MRLVFLGAPGVGKGTQAEILCRNRGWRHISTGELLREAVSRETSLGMKAKEAMDRGDLVQDEIIYGLITEALNGISGGGFVLDGFPRNMLQAKGLDNILEERGERLDRVVLLEAGLEEIMNRLAGRGRSDDSAETVRRRLEVYERATAPLVEYYEEKGILERIGGVGTIEDISHRIEASLGESSGKTSWSS